MKEKIKKILKNRILIFILGGIVFGTIGVSAATYFESNLVTYDNTESGLSSTDVQGAIDELYNECFPPEPTGGNMILDMVDLVASGDGLYEDKYEEDKYTYKGANPNNYITFNGEKAGWRIISIEKSGIIKIVKSDSIGKMAWDSSSTNWAKPASLNTYLNETYYNNKLTSTAKNMIVSHSFGIGAVTDRNNNLTEQIKEENSVT